MKTSILAFFGIFMFCSVSLAQSWQTLGTGFFGPGHFSSNIQVLSYQDTAFVAYSDMDMVYLKKRSGNSWVTVGTYATENDYYKFIYGHDNKPLFVRLTRGQADVGTTGFYADIHLYENGVMTLLESRLLEFVADNQVSNLQVSNFDFAARADGSMACIIRFPSSARSVYNVKIGSHEWFAETVFYSGIGGSSGNAIERSKISFNEQGVVIVSRLFNQTLGASHLFLHDLNSSTPTASHLNSGAFSVGSGIEPIFITSKGDTTYAVIRDQLSNEILWKFYYDASNEPLSLSQILNYGNNGPRVIPIFTENENYLMYFESFEGEGFIATVDNTFELSSAQNFGDTYFTMNENLVSPAVFNVDPVSGEVYVAYVHGPPMTQTRLRKFGCGNATAAFNSSTETLSVSSTHDASATFEWTLCESNDVLSTASSFEPEEDGLYQVTVTEGDCVMTSTCVEVQLQNEDPGVGIENSFLAHVAVYPNPAIHEFIIDGIKELSDIQIIDLAGNIVWNEKNCNDFVHVNSSNWTSGIYFVHIQTGSLSNTYKLIKK